MIFLTSLPPVPFNGTVTISVVLAVVALISPSITAVINNRHLMKIKLIDVTKENARIDYNNMFALFSTYLDNVSIVLDRLIGDSYLPLELSTEYRTSYLKCLLIADDNTRILFEEVDEKINSKEWELAESRLVTLTNNLQSQLRQYKDVKD